MKIYEYDELMRMYKHFMKEVTDVREGTLCYMTGSVIAMELAQLYDGLEEIYKNAFATTAEGENLDKAIAVWGIKRIGESCAVVRMEGDKNFFAGDEFTNGNMVYKIILAEDDYYLAECKTAGVVGNEFTGEVIPVNDKEGFERMEITQIVAMGAPEETDEKLRERFLERLNCPVSTGNVTYYKNALAHIAGVGGIKIEPVSEGVGTVKVIITDELYNSASEELVDYVKELLDPEEASGRGYGIVPMGHKVTVESAESVDITIDVRITGGAQRTYYQRIGNSILPPVITKLNEEWEKNEKTVIRDRIVEDCLFTMNGVEDVDVVSINGTANRLILEKNQIIGSVRLNVL